jgi:cytochrome c
VEPRTHDVGRDERAEHPLGDLNDQAAADLFAYFYSVRFFEKPGDAGRGKSLFKSKRCADCHGLTQAKLPAARPVSQWESIGQPIALAGAMWNHGATMREEFGKRNLKWPELTSQDLTDLLVYLRNLPELRNTRMVKILNRSPQSKIGSRHEEQEVDTAAGVCDGLGESGASPAD